MNISEIVRRRMESIRDLLREEYPSGTSVTRVGKRLGVTDVQVAYAVRKLGERIDADGGWLRLPRAERDALWAAELETKHPLKSPFFGYARFDVDKNE